MFTNPLSCLLGSVCFVHEGGHLGTCIEILWRLASEVYAKVNVYYASVGPGDKEPGRLKD